MANEPKKQPQSRPKHATHLAVIIAHKNIEVMKIGVDDVSEHWTINGMTFTLLDQNFCLVDAVQNEGNLLALRIFLLGDLKVPAHFRDVKEIDVDSDTSLFIWLKPTRVLVTDETYISLQDLGERLYTTSHGDWLMLFAIEPFIKFGLDSLVL